MCVPLDHPWRRAKRHTLTHLLPLAAGWHTQWRFQRGEIAAYNQTSSACPASDFPINLDGLRCNGMRSASAVREMETQRQPIIVVQFSAIFRRFSVDFRLILVENGRAMPRWTPAARRAAPPPRRVNHFPIEITRKRAPTVSPAAGSCEISVMAFQHRKPPKHIFDFRSWSFRRRMFVDGWTAGLRDVSVRRSKRCKRCDSLFCWDFHWILHWEN